MAINHVDLAFKILLNRRVTDSDGKYYFNEFGDETLNIHAKEIWADDIDPDPSVAIFEGVAEYRELFIMTEDITVPNRESWFAEEDGGRLRDWIPDKYGLDYKVQLYDANGNEIFPTNDCEWFFNFKTGILTFNSNADSFPQPFKISAHRYIGTKGITSSSGGGSTPIEGAYINLFPTLTTPYNKTQQVMIPEGNQVTNFQFDLSQTFLAGKRTELVGYSIGANRWNENDYINIDINGLVIEDTWYTREAPEKDGIGNGGIVYSLPENSIINIDFYNESGKSKTIWFKVKLLYNP